MTKKILADYQAPPTDGAAPVAAVTHQQVCDALEPLVALLGTSLGEVMANSLEIHPDRISFVSCVPVAGVEPVRWGGEEQDHAEDGVPYAAIWAWPVVVEVIRP